MDAGSYWFVSVPAEPSKTEAVKRINTKLAKEHSYSHNFTLELPPLKIGTLDGLIQLSDEMQRTDSYVESVVQKIAKVFLDLQKKKYRSDTPTKGKKPKHNIDKMTLKVKGRPYEQYVQQFEWDAGRYPPTTPLLDLMNQIEARVQGLEDQIKEKTQEYANTQASLTQIERSQTGSLALRDLTGLVKETDFVDTSRLTTAIVIVPKFQFKQFEAEYASLVTQKVRDIQSSFVVPNSHRRLAEDKEHGLYTVVLFKRVMDDFVAACRTKRYIVREFHFDTERVETQKNEAAELEVKMENVWSKLTAWCRENFGEVFAAWMHLKCIRLFVETCLRYSVPPNYAALLIKPNRKCEKKVHSMLAMMYSHLGNEHMAIGKGNAKVEEPTAVASLSSMVDFHPYVVFKMDLSTRE